MYSGSDSTDSQKFTQWAMHPSAYQNMPKDSIDWAALAQQWIIMKEAGPPPMPDHKRPPPKERRQPANEGGEAPMVMEGKEAPGWSGATQPQPPGMEPWGWNASQPPPNWGWNSFGTGPGAPPTCPPPPSIKPPLLPTPANHGQFAASPPAAAPVENVDTAAQFSGYNSTSTNDYQPGYWTSSPTHPPPKHMNIKPHNRKYSKVNVPTVQRNLPPASVPATVTPLDAAKRKTLPAWIREGLEKMERDKLKQMEIEKQKYGRDGEKDKVKLDEKETMEILKHTIQERRKSRFESDEESDEEIHGKKIKDESPEPTPLTHDELMLKVRKLMTEVLLKVTNREIEVVCREEHQRHLKRSKASDQRLSAPSGANMSTNLGLGMYGSDSGSSDGSDDDSQYDRKDSDAELRESIRRKKVDFVRTERDIEGKIAQNDRKGGNDSRSSTPDTNDNDSQVEQKYQGRNRSRSHDSPETTPQHSRGFHEEKYCSQSENSDSEGEEEYGANSGHHHARRSSSTASSRSKQRSESPDERRYRHQHQDKAEPKAAARRATRSRSRSAGRKRRSRSASPRQQQQQQRRDGRLHRRSSRSSSYSRSSRRSRSATSPYSRRSSDSRRRSSRHRSRSRSSGSRRRARRRSSESRDAAALQRSRSRRSRTPHGPRSSHHRHRSRSGSSEARGGGKRSRRE